MSANVPPLHEVANFVTFYFPLKIKILAKREREVTTKFAIARNGCWQLPFLFLRFYFLFSFSFPLSVKCLFYSCRKLVHFGGCLFHFGEENVRNKRSWQGQDLFNFYSSLTVMVISSLNLYSPFL